MILTFFNEVNYNFIRSWICISVSELKYLYGVVQLNSILDYPKFLSFNADHDSVLPEASLTLIAETISIFKEFFYSRRLILLFYITKVLNMFLTL